VGIAAVMFTAACGGGGTSASQSPGGTAKSSPNTQAGFAECLRQHGITRPTGQPSGRPQGQRPSMSPEQRTAMEACRSLRPNGGRGGGMGGTAFQAYRSCLKNNGVDLPQGPGGARQLKTTDPKVAQALKKCRPLMPTGTPSAAPS
jgi:hypothetical protein